MAGKTLSYSPTGYCLSRPLPTGPLCGDPDPEVQSDTKELVTHKDNLSTPKPVLYYAAHTASSSCLHCAVHIPGLQDKLSHLTVT